jgi:AcrR family transcriptional regulator
MSSLDAILDAAEHVFALQGYGGASMRQIAEEAGVAQALLHYHFKTKDKLYEAIFARRATVINGFRESALDDLFREKKAPTLDDVLEVLFSLPAQNLIQNKRHGNAFQQIVTAVSVSDDPRSVELMMKYYDPIAKRFVDALQRVVPGLSVHDAAWAYLFALGARMQTHARNDRARRLARGKDTSSPHARILPFIAAGIRDMVKRKATLARARPTRGKDLQA